MNITMQPKKVKRTAPPVEVAERRVWVRYSCDLSVRCKGADDGFEYDGSGRRYRARARSSYLDLTKRFAAKVSNISRGGMRVEVQCPFEKGSRFNIELDRGSRQKPLILTATVKQVTPISTGNWSIGCAFTDILDEDELETLLLFGPAKKGFDSSIFTRWFRAAGRAVAGCLAFLGVSLSRA